MSKKDLLWFTDNQIERQLKNPVYRITIEKRWKIFEEILLHNNIKEKQSISVLDAGVGDGINLVFLNRILSKYTKNNKIFACDFSSLRIRRAKKFKFVSNFKIVDLKSTNYKSNQFDLIICNHVLEHIKEVDLAVKELKRILKPKGLMILNVPNEGCLMAKIRNYIFQREILKITDHVHFFNKQSFLKVLKKNKIIVQKVYRAGFFFPYFPLINIRKYLFGRYLEKVLSFFVSSQSADLIVSVSKSK